MRAFLVRETDKAVLLVKAEDAKIPQVQGAWIPRSKLESFQETDDKSVTISTKQDGERIGFPYIVTVNAAFAQKIGF